MQTGSCIPICQSTLLKPYSRVLHYFFRFFHIYSIKLVKNITRKNIISNASVISNGLPDIKPYKTYIKLLPRIMTSVFINASITKLFIKILPFLHCEWLCLYYQTITLPVISDFLVLFHSHLLVLTDKKYPSLCSVNSDFPIPF